MTQLLNYPELLAEVGINTRVLMDWDKPHRTSSGRQYLWRTNDPEASMWHHTASSSYTPNRIKANMYAGLMYPGSSDFRLHQSGGGDPTIVIANAFPGPITSGYGQESVLDLARDDIRNNNLAVGPDDADPRWAGNKSYWNTEIVLDGVGTWIDDEVWEVLILAGAVLHELMGWSEWRAIGHAQHTRRKPDPNDGRYGGAKDTMIAFRSDLGALLTEEDDGMATLEEFVGAIRYTDIDKMVADQIIQPTEGEYFKHDQPWPGQAEDHSKKVTDHPDWNNLYVSWKVRAPIWAV